MKPPTAVRMWPEAAWAGPVLLVAALGAASCGSDALPKPRAYPRIHFPERTGNQVFRAEACPFRFELPSYYEIQRKGSFLGEEPEHPCWGYNLHVPELNGTIHLTYKELGPGQTLLRVTEEAHKLTFKHARKADFIEPLPVETEHGVHGLIYEVGGDAASAMQFFATDTVAHFLRGSLHFYARPNEDSLAPVVRWMGEDIEAILHSLRWDPED